MRHARLVSLSFVSFTFALAVGLSGCSKDSKESGTTKSGGTAADEAPAAPALAPMADEGVHPTDEQLATIINVAGRQRMLTQKMAKEVLLGAAGIDAAQNKTNAAESLALFKKSHNGLRNGDETMHLPKGHFGKVNARLDDLQTAFKPFEVLIEKGSRESLSKEEQTQVANLTDALLEKEEPIVSIVSGRAGVLGFQSAVIDVAGRQRMFTQKMTKDAVLVYLKIDADKHRTELQKTGSLFEKVLAGLKHGDSDIKLSGATEPAMKAQLDTVTALWKPFYEIAKAHAQSKKDMTKQEVETVAKLNLPLLKEANKVVEMMEGANVGQVAAAPAAPAVVAGGPKK